MPSLWPQLFLQEMRQLLLALALVGACAAEPADFHVIKGQVKLPKTVRPPTMRVVLNDGAAGEEDVADWRKKPHLFLEAIFQLRQGPLAKMH